jgi:Secretion system C-terminal sorting domain
MKTSIASLRLTCLLLVSFASSAHLNCQELIHVGNQFFWLNSIGNQVFTNYNPNMSNKIVLDISLDFTSQQDWNLLNESSALMSFYNQYGPNGTGDVQLIVSFGVTEDCFACAGSDTMSYCVCQYHGQGTATVGDWSGHMPLDALVLNFANSLNPIDSSYFFGEPVNLPVGLMFFEARMPDHRYYKMPFPPTLSSMQNLFALRDTLNGDNNAALIYGIIDKGDHCPVDDTRSGTFWLSNNGHDTLTTARIGLFWNGVMTDSLLWTGAIPPYEHRTIHDLDGHGILMDSLDGTLEVVVLEVNGQPDEEPANSSWQQFSSKAISIDQNDLIFEWNTSNFTETNYFELVAEDGTKIFQLGDPSILFGQNLLLTDTFDNETTYQFPIDITGYEKQCLQFNARHYLGGYFGNSIRLSAGEQEVFNYSGFSIDFGGRKLYHGMPDAAVSAKDEQVKAALCIKPNPANQQVVLQANQLQAGQVSWAAYNAIGQQVWSQKSQELSSSAEISVDIITWPAGLYFVTVSDEQGTVSSRLVVEH